MDLLEQQALFVHLDVELAILSHLLPNNLPSKLFVHHLHSIANSFKLHLISINGSLDMTYFIHLTQVRLF
jgi:hypothetical protein